MRAALVTSFDMPPRCTEVADPVAGSPEEVVVEVVAAGLHPRVRSQIDGSHYTSTGALPLVPGIDGVGRTADGTLRYFVLPDTTMGSMAERTVIDLRRSVVLPADTDPLLVGAGMNPATGSWVALRRRIEFTPGQQVLVLGATGSAGRMAVQVAKHLGAARVVAAGRNADRLAALRDLGADETVTIGASTSGEELGRAAGEVDVVLDFLWGRPAVDAMRAVVTERSDRGRPLTWVQIGSVAGRNAEVPSEVLRAARLQLVGSGQGSVPTRDIVAELPDLAAQIGRGTFAVDAYAVTLDDVGDAWAGSPSGPRPVVVP